MLQTQSPKWQDEGKFLINDKRNKKKIILIICFSLHRHQFSSRMKTTRLLSRAVFDSTLHHHHQTPSEGISFWKRAVFFPPSRVQSHDESLPLRLFWNLMGTWHTWHILTSIGQPYSCWKNIHTAYPVKRQQQAFGAFGYFIGSLLVITVENGFRFVWKCHKWKTKSHDTVGHPGEGCWHLSFPHSRSIPWRLQVVLSVGTWSTCWLSEPKCLHYYSLVTDEEANTTHSPPSLSVQML